MVCGAVRPQSRFGDKLLGVRVRVRYVFSVQCAIHSKRVRDGTITGVHSSQDLLLCVKIGVYMGFWVHRGS